MPLTARRYIRKMRGGAQAHLLETDDGSYYIVKFRNNPQHRRILVNELIAGVLLEYLQISVPPTTLVRISTEFLSANPEVHMILGSRKIPVEPGWHFGSRYPGDPAQLAVYDFIPDALLHKVNNLDDFLAVLVFDRWAANADGRQSVFFRARVRNASGGPARPGFVALMIDHGFVFNGPNWDFTDSPLQGLYGRKLVYERVRSLDDFQPWLDRVVYLPEEVMDRAYRMVPPEWLDGEEDQCEGVLEELLRRRKQAPDLVTRCRQSKWNPFPNWT